MSYKFQIGSAALSGAVIQRLGTKANSQYVLQDDGGTSRLILKAGSKGSISGSGGLEFTTGSFSGQLVASVVDLNGGNIDGTAIGAASQAAGAFTTLSASSTLNVVGAANFGPANKVVIAADGGLTIDHFDANWTNAGRTVADMGILTTVDINGGSVDGATIGAASQSSVKATTLSASSTLDVVGVSRFGPANKATISAAGVISGSSLTIAGTAALEGLITTNGGLTSKGTVSGSALTIAGTSALEGLITTNGGLTSKGAISGSSTLDVVGVARFGPANKAQISAAGVISGSALQIAGACELEGAVTVSRNVTSKGTISGSALTIAGAAALEGLITTNGGLTSKGALSGSSTLSVAGNVQLDGADDSQAFVAADSLYFRDAGTGQMRRDSFSDVMEVAAGTVTLTGLENTSGVLSLAIHSLDAEVIATGDKLAFADAGDNGLHSETVDDLFTKGPALVTEAAIAVADDYVMFLDGGASGDAKKEQWADIVSAIAGAGLSANAGVLSSDASPTPNELVHGETLSEGLNYATGSKNATVYLPQNADFGDTIRLKSQALANGKVITVSPKAGGGTTIDGESSVALRSQYGAITMIYAVTGSWLIV